MNTEPQSRFIQRVKPLLLKRLCFRGRYEVETYANVGKVHGAWNLTIERTRYA